MLQLLSMLQEEVPKNLPGRTGKHLCIHCLAETPEEEYFRNDHVCDDCAAKLDGVEPSEVPEVAAERQERAEETKSG